MTTLTGLAAYVAAASTISWLLPLTLLLLGMTALYLLVALLFGAFD